MSAASVGFHCPECVAGGGQRVIPATRALRPERSAVAMGIIGVNVAVYVAGLLADRVGSPLDSFQVRFGLARIAVAYGEWWRVITSGFLHAGALHLAMNMWALYVFGTAVERMAGRTGLLLTYACGLVGGALGVVLLSGPADLTVGASGALFGLLGSVLVFQLVNRVNIWQSGLGGLVLLNLAITFGIPGISIGGHLGGLVAGGVAGVALYVGTPGRRPGEQPPADRLVAVGALTLVLFGLTLYGAPLLPLS